MRKHMWPLALIALLGLSNLAGCADPAGPYTAEEIGVSSQPLMRSKEPGGGGAAHCKITDTSDESVPLPEGDLVTTANGDKWCCNSDRSVCYLCDNYGTKFHCLEKNLQGSFPVDDFPTEITFDP